MDRVDEKKVRDRIRVHLHRGGLTDGDMRALGDAAGLFVSRPNRIDDGDPLEPINDRILTILVIGERDGSDIERRYVLVLDHRGDEIDVADPAGEGLTAFTADELNEAWKLGARNARPWLGTVSAR